MGDSGKSDFGKIDSVPGVKGDFSWLSSPGLLRLFDLYAAAGFELRPVGGCVRDSLLGQPVADIDIASNCPPETGMALLKAGNVKVVPTGLKHGTITAVIDHQPYEITCLRHDLETDGRHAIVSWTDDWQADAARRDFTVNALYVDRYGHIHDWFEGLADLRAGRVRFVGDPVGRIKEDYLRILRFYRFSARFALGLDPAGHRACLEQSSGLASISVERIWSEWKKLLLAPKAQSTVEAMIKDGITGILFPDFAIKAASFDRLPLDSVLRMARLMQSEQADSSNDEASVFAAALKLSRRETQYLTGLLQSELRDEVMKADFDQSLRRLAYRHGTDIVSGHLYLLRHKAAANIAAWQIPAFPLGGKDLIAAGISPGPAMGKVMARLQQQWIDSDFAMNRMALLKVLDGDQ